MALRIGKKKSGEPASSGTPDTAPAAVPAAASESDDWSDFGNIPNETSSATAGTEDWTSFDDLVDPSLDGPITAPPTAGAIANTPSVPATSVTKKGPPKVALIAIPVLLVGAGGVALFLKQSSPVVDEMPAATGAIVAPRPKKPAPPTNIGAAPKAAALGSRPGAAKPIPGKPAIAPAGAKPGTKPGAAIAPITAKAAVKPGAAASGTPVALAVKPAAKPGTPSADVTRIASRPGNTDALASVEANKEPTPPPSANPGITIDPHHVALAAPVGAKATTSTAGMTPAQVAKRTRLKLIWNDGAAAKKSGDKAKARKLWTQGLKQAEASPRMDASAAGFRGSLAKLK